MENEIKRLEKNRSVTIVVMLVIMLAIVLSACTVSAGGEPHVKSKSEKAIERGRRSGDPAPSRHRYLLRRDRRLRADRHDEPV